MPDFYDVGEYDLAGFTVGIVDRKNIVDGSAINIGDKIIGIPSSGVHSNGYSLVRKVFFDKMGYDVNTKLEDLQCTLGELLLTPTKLYVKPVLEVLEKVKVNGMVHVTGGGFFENIPRVLADNQNAKININEIETLPVFKLIQKCGNIERDEMYSAFNMGVGFMLFVKEDDVEKTLEILAKNGENAKLIGEVIEGEKGVTLCE